MRVLVVDDDDTSVLLATTLVGKLGHESDTARNAEDAWAKLEATDYDVLVTDVVMPGADGLELCRRVRSDDSRKYTYVILVTADARSTRVLEAMRAGADDYVTKPLSPVEVEARFIAAARVLTLQRRLETMARVDPLTGLGNRLALAEAFADTDARATRYDHAFVVALIDLDRFKPFNDTYGHPAGDEVLRQVAEVLRRNARAGDEVYRYGGEELLWLLAEQNVARASIALERFRSAVEALAIPHEHNPPSRVVTISAGLAALSAARKRSSDAVKAADEALYRAKREGRNCIVSG